MSTGVDKHGKPILAPPAQATNIVNPSNTVAYVMVGIVVVSVFLAVGIVVISVFGPSEGQAATIGALIGAISPVLVAMIGFLLTKKVDAVHVQLNQRMTEYLLETGRASTAEGQLLGRAEGRAESQSEVHNAAAIPTARVADATERLADTAERLAGGPS